MNRKAVFGFALAAVAIVMLVAYARPISQLIVGLFFQELPKNKMRIPLAKIENIEGAAFIKRAGDSDFKPLKSNTELVHFDQLQIEKGSSATLQFASGWRLELASKTNVILESYRPDSPSAPILLNLIYGNYTVSQPGTQGLLFISRENKIFAPQSPVKRKERQIIVAPAIVQNIENNNDITLVKPEKTNDLSQKITNPEVSALPSAKTPGKMPEKLATGDEETLSSPYIESVLSAHASDFRRCQLNSLRDQKPTEASILLSLTIQPNGKPQNVKVLQNSSDNLQLADCTKSVLERAQFRAFSGLPITLTYPLEFK